MILLQIFLGFARVGLFAFGGGYATLKLIEDLVVNSHAWLSFNEYLELITISQLTPGPIAINAATYVGYKVGGVWGSALATIGFCLPSVTLILIIASFLKRFAANPWVNKIIKGLRMAVIALIASSAYSIVAKGQGIIDIAGVLIAVAAFIALRTKKVDAIMILLSAGVLGLIIYH